jgi:hypothetical protein
VEYLFGIFIAAIVAWFIYRSYRYGGFKGGMFGATIDETVGESSASVSLGSVALKVHILRRSDQERLIGIEVTTRSVFGGEVSALTLSVPEAEQLATLLQNAARAR